MNLVTFHQIALMHHQDLLHAAEQQRAAHLAQQERPATTRPSGVIHLPARSTPCATC
ncbi:hypothetical protein ACFP9V_18530 [Deinococcus radiopugnans]|uniref:Uncharacterized protein n=1 Tax=Deinococcus radiopugnans ATCC 19172 TaxID=585398 RepID=A0ABR6NTR9_9DEIO|nr:hypothetical protein [Deinococcus radiopugnans]MBB6017444.1 hypothetical protein [Deinococcus radiopugnans ATCC 19172]